MAQDMMDRKAYARLPEGEALLADPERGDTLDPHQNQGQVLGRPVIVGKPLDTFQAGSHTATGTAAWGLAAGCTILLSAVYAFFSLSFGMMSIMICDAPGSCEGIRIVPVYLFMAYIILGGWAAAAISCAYAIMGSARRPWCMKHTLNMAPVLAHFMSIVLVILVSAGVQSALGQA